MTAPFMLTEREYSAWLWLLLPPHRESGVIAVYQCGVDESGTHKGAPLLVVAGCVSTPEQWDLFGRDWLPEINSRPKGYHAVSAPPWLNEKLADLMRVRMDYTPVITISEDEYRTYAPEEYRSVFGTAYALAVSATVALVGQYCERTNVEWASYVVETGHKHRPGVDKFFKTVLASPSLQRQRRVWSQTWSSKKDPTVHPADLLAHELGTLGPLSGALHQRADQQHIGPDQIREFAEIGLNGWREYRRLKAREKGGHRRGRRSF